MGGEVKPIIFNTEMVQAILDGKKVCTRRPVKKGLIGDDGLLDSEAMTDSMWRKVKKEMPMSFGHMFFAPYKKDNILYVRETWAYLPMGTTGRNPLYRATDTLYNNIKWKPSIHMPKKAARIFLKVTNVRVERVQDISMQEALNEGFKSSEYKKKYKETPYQLDVITAIGNFAKTWDSIYKNWDSNPWVWVIDFEVVNI